MSDSPKSNPPSSRPIDAMLLDRYLADTASEADRSVVAAWMAESESHTALVDVARSGRRDGKPLAVDVERALERLWRAEAGTGYYGGSATPLGVESDARQPWSGTRGRVAGLGTLLMRRGVAGLGTQTLRQSAWVLRAVVALLVVGATIAGWGKIMPRSREVERPLVYTSSAGQQGLITLPDGSSIRLNVASRLEVPADYTRGNRVIRLQGEARIVATHDARNPLSVITAGTAIQVLGTTFFVRRYSTDTVTTVAVLDGKVAVDANVVPAGRALTVDDHRVARLRMIDSSDFSFESGVLRLPQAPLVDVISALNRWYGADIRIADPSLRTKSFGGDFPLGSPSDLELYLKPLGAHVERNGAVLTLSRRTP